MANPRLLLAALLAGMVVIFAAVTPLASSTTTQTPQLAWRKEFPGASTVWAVAAEGGQVALHARYPRGPEGTASEGQLLCVDLASGKERWRSTALAERSASVDAGRLYLIRPTELLALDWATGRKLWSKPVKADVLYPLLAQQHRVVYRERGGAVVAADGTTGRELWRLTPPREYDRLLPLTFALGGLYLQETLADGHYLAALNPATGITEQQVRLERPEDLDYVLSRLHWSPEQRRFFLEEVRTGAGIDFRSIRALQPDLSLAWRREHLGPFALADGVLVCDAWKSVHNERLGLAGVDPRSGRVLWRRTEAGAQEQSLIGGLGSSVAVSQANRMLRGLLPRSGREVWSRSLPFTKVQVCGSSLLAFSDGEGAQPASVSAYVAQDRHPQDQRTCD